MGSSTRRTSWQEGDCHLGTKLSSDATVPGGPGRLPVAMLVSGTGRVIRSRPTCGRRQPAYGGVMEQDVSAGAENTGTSEGTDDPFEEMDPETSRNPQPSYKLMRDLAPTFRVPRAGVIVSRRADVEQVLHNPDIFSSALEAAPLGNVRPLIPLQIDPPEHRKFRKILQPLFSPQRMAELEKPIAEIVRVRIDGFDGTGRDRFREGILGALPLAGLPDPAGSAARRTPAVPEDEGRDHPAAARHRRAVRPPRSRCVPTRDGGVHLRLLRPRPRPA